MAQKPQQSKTEVFEQKFQKQKDKVEQVEKDLDKKVDQEDLEKLEKTLQDVDSELDALQSSVIDNIDIQTEKEQAEESLKNLQEQIKKILKKIKEKYQESLTELKESVKEVTAATAAAGETINPTTTTGEEDKNWISRQRDGLTSKEERDNKPLNNIARIAGGVGAVALVYKGIKWIGGLFGGDKEEGGEKKGFLDSGLGKALKWLGLGGLAAYLGRRFFTGKNDFFGLGKESEDDKTGKESVPGGEIINQSKDYEKLTDAEKLPYDSMGNHINSYYKNALGGEGVDGVEDMLGDSSFDKNKEGLVPWILDNRYKNVKKILNERSFFYEIVGSEVNVMRDRMKDRGIDQVKTLIMPLLVGIDNLPIPLVELNMVQKTDEFVEKIKSIPGAEERVRTVFRKSMSTVSYLESRRRKLEYTLTYNYLKEHNEDGFATLSEKRQKKRVLSKLKDDEWCERNIDPEINDKFLGKGMKDAFVYLENQEVLDDKLDEIVQSGIDIVDERKDKLLEIEDEDDASVIENIKDELEGGKLTPEGKDKLLEFCKSRQEEIDGFGKRSWYNRYLPILEMTNLGDDTLDKILNSGDYEGIVSSYKEKIGEIIKKSDKGVLTQADFTDLEYQVQDYFKLQKSIITTQLNMTEVRNKDGSVTVRWMDTIVKGGKGMQQGIQMVVDGDTWDKIKGGVMITGGFATIDLLTWPVRSAIQMGPAKSPTAKIAYRIGRFSLKKTGRALNKLTGRVLRSRTPFGLGSIRYNEHSLRIAIAKGELTLDRALQIAKRKELTVNLHSNAKIIENKQELLRSIFDLNPDDAKRVENILEQYGDNKRVYKEVLQKKYNKTGRRRIKNPKHRGKRDIEQTKFLLNESGLVKLERISREIDQLSDTEKVVYRQAMRYAKSIDSMDDIVKMGTGEDMIKILQKGELLTAEKYGKYLAKYGNKIDINDMRSFEKFILEAQKSKKITGSSERFIRNSMKKFHKIKEGGFKIDKIDNLKLNANKRERIAESTKTNLSKMTGRLSKMIKSPRFKPFHGGIKKQITALNEYRKTITPKGMKALAESRVMGNASFAKLTDKGIDALRLLNTKLDKKLLKAISKAKTPEKIRELLGSRGINHTDIADEVLIKLSKTKSMKRVKDIINYGAEFKAVKGFQKLIKNPAIKYGGRVFGRVMIGADFLFQAYNFSSNMNEVNRIKKTNLNMGEWKEDQAYFELASGGIGAVAGVCMFIPGVGWIAGGVLGASMIVQEVGAKYYEDIAKFKQNKLNFLDKGLAATKQELLSLDSWGSNLSRSWIDRMNSLDSNWNLLIPGVGATMKTIGLVGSNSVEKKEQALPKTKEDALHALLYMEEIKRHYLAAADLNSKEFRDDDVMRNRIIEEKEIVDKTVEKRFEYFKKNYIEPRKSLVSRQDFEKNEGINAIEIALQESEIYNILSLDTTYEGEKTPEAYKQYMLDNLQKNKTSFDKLEAIFKGNNRTLFLIYAQKEAYYQMLYEYGTEIEDKDKIIQNIKYFENYMQYKIVGVNPSDLPDIDYTGSEINYNAIHNFFENLEIKGESFEESETQDDGLYLSDEQLRIRYGVTTNVGQNILYEFAKNNLGYPGKNILSSSGQGARDLEKFYHEGKKGVHGIYFDGKEWAVNEKTWRDDDFGTSDKLNNIRVVKKMRKYVNANTNKWNSGKMFTESSEVNKELGARFLDIADSNISLYENRDKIKEEIKNYISDNTVNGLYVQLPLDLIIKGTKAGIAGLGAAVFRMKGNNIEYRTTIENYISPF